MALNVGTLYAQLSANVAEFKKNLEAASKAVEDVRDSLESVRNTAAVASAALSGVAGVAVKTASDFNEARGAMEAAFGSKAADGITAWSKTLSDSVGASTRQVMEFATELKLALGSGANAGKTAQGLTQLAYDLAAIRNRDPSDVLRAFQMGLMGSDRELKRLGVTMSDEALSAYALSRGINVAFKDLDEASKVSVRSAYLFDQVKFAMGGARDASSSFEGQSRKLRGGLEELGNSFGQALLPAATKTLEAINAVIDRLRNLDKSTVQTVASVGAFAAGLTAAVAAATTVVLLIPKLTAAFAALKLVVGALRVAFVKAFLPLAIGIAGAVLLVGALKQAWDENLFGIQEGVASLRQFMGESWEWIVKTAARAWEKVGEIIGMVLGFAQRAFLAYINRVIDGLSALVRGAAAITGKDFSGALAGIEEFRGFLNEGGLGDSIKGAFSTLKDATTSIATSFAVGAKDIATTSAKGIVDSAKIGGELLSAPLKALVEKLEGLMNVGSSEPAADPKAPAVGKVSMSAEAAAEARKKELAELKKLEHESMERAKARGYYGVSGRAQMTTGISEQSHLSNLAATARAFTAKVNGALMDAGRTIVAGLARAGEHVGVIANGLVGIFDAAKAKGQELGTGLLDGLSALTSGGDLLGILVGVIAGLLLQSKALMNAFAMLDIGLAAVVGMLDPLFGGLESVIAVVGALLVAISSGLKPVFAMLGVILTQLADAIYPLVPVIAVLMQFVGVLAVALFNLIPANAALRVVIMGLGRALAAVALVITAVIYGLGQGWNAIVIVLQWLLRKIADLASIVSDDVAKSIRAWSGSLDGLKFDSRGAEKAMGELTDMVVNGVDGRSGEAKAILQATSSVTKLGETATRVAESLLNVPDGYKVAMQRFGNMLTGNQLTVGGLNFGSGGTGSSSSSSPNSSSLLDKLPKFATGGVVDRPTVALVGEGGEREYIIPESKMPGGLTIGPVNIVSNDPEEIWRKLKRVIERETLANTGGLFPAGPRWAGR